MANWSDPRSTVTAAAAPVGTRAEGLDAGLRGYMLSVYNMMASGVLLTGIVALAMVYTSAVNSLFNPATGKPALLAYALMIAPFGLVMVLSFGINRLSETTAKALFWAYAALMGASLSTILLVYTGTSVAQVFFATAAAFGGLSLWGYTTKRDLTAMGTFLIMGLIGLIVASVINLFLQSSAMQMVISAIGVLIFAGLTAYDTQKIKSMYFQVAGTSFAGKSVVMGALTLYLDFINMFLFLLRLFGDRR